MGWFRKDRDDVDVTSMLENLGRLDAVTSSRFMDAPRSQRLDDLIERAAGRLQAPTAFMAILDDQRAFYAAETGLDAPTAAAREEPAAGTYCKYVVAYDDVMQIDDALTDERVKDHPVTTAGRARAYLGVPLRENGHTIGSFCVVDSRPRTWTDDDVRMLQEYAEDAMNPAFR